MGEIADMMLDGTMCSSCGVWLHDGADGPGYPQLCGSCGRSERTFRGHQCADCPRTFQSEYALGMHRAAKHEAAGK